MAIETRFHFLNVGQGDCTVITSNGAPVCMIDINNAKDYSSQTKAEIARSIGWTEERLQSVNKTLNFSEMLGTEQLQKAGVDLTLENPIDYLLRLQAQGVVITYFQTHPDKDHFTGLSDLLKHPEITIQRFFDTGHTITKDISTENVDWLAYLDLREKGLAQNVWRGEKYVIEDITFHIFHPDQATIEEINQSNAPSPNDCSIVMVVEVFGKKLVLPGDLETPLWESLYEHIKVSEDLTKLFAGIDVLKASHHGRESGKTDPYGSKDFLNLMDPDIVVVSVGTKTENDVTDWYRQRPNDANGEKRDNRRVLSTVYEGNIYASIQPDSECMLDTEKNIRNEAESAKAIADASYQDHGIYELPESKWIMNLKERVRIKADKHRRNIAGDGPGLRLRGVTSNNFTCSADEWLTFRLDRSDKGSNLVYWQVINTGSHASSLGTQALRGEIFKGKSRNYHQERTEYTGVHSVECFLVDESTGQCVARSGKFFVRVHNSEYK